MDSDKQTSTMSAILSSLNRSNDVGTTMISKLDAFKAEILTTMKSSQTDSISKEDLSRVVSDLITFVNEALRPKKAQSVLNSLYFDELHDREFSMRSAHMTTYNWIFGNCNDATYKDVKFFDWLVRGSGIYWINGKAGSGKSTLMKLVHNHECTKSALDTWAHGKNLIIASHFFWSGGTEMQMSQLGLLRSLLYQILAQCPDLIPHVFPLRLQNENVRLTPWTSEEISTAFERLAVQDLRPLRVCFFIDGLDECHSEHRDLVDLLIHLSRMKTFKICAASRAWNIFKNAFSNNDAQVLALHEYTRHDISTFVRDKLQEEKGFSKLRKSNLAYEMLVNDITEKAEGVFLWVFLVVRSLLRGVDDGNDFSTMQKRVQDLPSDLEQYFQHVLDNLDQIYQA